MMMEVAARFQLELRPPHSANRRRFHRSTHRPCVVHRSVTRHCRRPRPAVHYGTKSGHFERSKFHFSTSEGVSEVSERASE